MSATDLRRHNHPELDELAAQKTILTFVSLSLFTLCIAYPMVDPMPVEKKRDLFPGALELMVLRTLALEALHGYALAMRIQQRSENLLQIDEGSLYPALQRLLRAELVSAVWQTSATNRRVRTYSITRKGLRHLEKETLRLDEMLHGIKLVLSARPVPAETK
jgi:PadR family transcriptional regulator PadR